MQGLRNGSVWKYLFCLMTGFWCPFQSYFRSPVERSTKQRLVLDALEQRDEAGKRTEELVGVYLDRLRVLNTSSLALQFFLQFHFKVEKALLAPPGQAVSVGVKRPPSLITGLGPRLHGDSMPPPPPGGMHGMPPMMPHMHPQMPPPGALPPHMRPLSINR